MNNIDRLFAVFAIVATALLIAMGTPAPPTPAPPVVKKVDPRNNIYPYDWAQPTAPLPPAVSSVVAVTNTYHIKLEWDDGYPQNYTVWQTNLTTKEVTLACPSTFYSYLIVSNLNKAHTYSFSVVNTIGGSWVYHPDIWYYNVLSAETNATVLSNGWKAATFTNLPYLEKSRTNTGMGLFRLKIVQTNNSASERSLEKPD